MNFNKVLLEMSAGTVRQFPECSLPEIAFSGKSNVGKSSLINCLLNRKALARVSAVPGKTVTINFYNIDCKCRFVDLPGYGYAKTSREKLGTWSPVVEKYFTSHKRCSLIVQLLDIRHDISENDALMLSYMDGLDTPFVVCLTKSDKLKKTEIQRRISYFETTLSQYNNIAQTIPFSCVTRAGRDSLIDMISTAANEEIRGDKL